MKKIYLLIILSVICVNGYSQIVNIPDANFKNALVNTICADFDGDFVYDDDVDTNNDGEIQVSEAEAVLGALNVRDQNISSLEGVQSFINILRLSCSRNELTSLDVSQNVNLVDLYCGENQLSNLDLSQNISLDYLGCSVNLLTSLDLSQNLSLYEVSCGGNLLSSIDLGKNQYLSELYCSNNQLTTLNLSENTGLRTVSCQFNQLQSIDLGQIPSIRNLYCNDNQLISLDVSQNPLLNDLTCNNNQLIYLNVQNGYNSSMNRVYTWNNPNLFCIQVDDETADFECLPGNFGWCPDPWTEYREECILGSVEFKNINLRLFPNPVQNTLYVLSDIPLDTIQVYSLTGQIIMTTTNTEISVSELSSGLYFAVLKKNGQSVIKKFIKS